MTLPSIILKPGKDQSLRRKHPWVFSGAIQRTEGMASNGDLVAVYNDRGQLQGTGHWSEGSIAVRMVAFGPIEDENEFWKEKIRAAYRLRETLGFIQNAQTTMYRLVHAEGDGLPGLVIDIYQDTAVIQAHSVGMHRHLPVFSDTLRELYGDRLKTIYDKSADKQKKNSGAISENTYLLGSGPSCQALEHGHTFRVDWEEGQKTGFFIDQRENRHLLGQYAAGKKVLNTFCYTGGFSVYALHAGAALVHSLDSSQRALDLTEENVLLNHLDTSRHAVVKADAVEYMKNIDTDYDIIVLDPPAFAKHLSARHKAVQGYKRINEAALRQIKKGGIIFTFSCSQAVTKELFYHTLTAAAIEVGREVRVLHQLHQPPDHPVSLFHPEGEYLKGLVLEVM